MRVFLIFLTAMILNVELAKLKRIIDEKNCSRRILNGDLATEKTFPYMVSLQKYNSGFRDVFTSILHALLGISTITDKVTKFCGGVIIDPEWILTASHCYEEELTSWGRRKDYRVKAGTIDAHSLVMPAQYVRVSKIILHPKYDVRKILNDIALLKLEEPLTLNEYVQPISLPPKNYVPRGDGIVLGWGTTDELEEKPSRYLRYATLRVADFSICNRYFSDITENHLCLGYENTQNACAGDSGGPFIQEIDHIPTVVGVLSYGTNGCHEKDPIVYTRVSAYVDWIKTTMNYN